MIKWKNCVLKKKRKTIMTNYRTYNKKKMNIIHLPNIDLDIQKFIRKINNKVNAYKKNNCFVTHWALSSNNE